jgi:hypothetical protein
LGPKRLPPRTCRVDLDPHVAAAVSSRTPCSAVTWRLNSDEPDYSTSCFDLEHCTEPPAGSARSGKRDDGDQASSESDPPDSRAPSRTARYIPPVNHPPRFNLTSSKGSPVICAGEREKHSTLVHEQPWHTLWRSFSLSPRRARVYIYIQQPTFPTRCPPRPQSRRARFDFLTLESEAL